MQNKKIVPIVIGLVLVAAVGAFAYMQSAKAPEPAAEGDMGSQAQQDAPTTTPPADAPTSTGPATQPPAGPTAYTMTQVAAHNNASSCWTAIRGSVYDLTAWIPQHPGGQAAIKQLCGTDGTSEFVGQHGGSAQQETKLATFKIGVLAQ